MTYDEIQGWTDFEELYQAQVLRARPGARFVEVGCWKGRSTAYMVSQIRRFGKQVEFFVIDHFKGGTRSDANGDYAPPPDLKEQFEANMVACGVWDQIQAIDSDSTEAADWFDDGSLDFVFIDGDHAEEKVYADLRAWWPKIRPGGLLAGHDFDEKGPRKGATRFADEEHVALYGDGSHGKNGYRCFGMPKAREKPAKIFLALPNYDGTAHSRAIVHAVACPYNFPGLVAPYDNGASSLTGNFNAMWASCLNDPSFTHFAMLHSDVVPMRWWLNVLMHELDATGVDMVSVVSPIKDKHGLTSTGIAYPGSDWFPLRRFSMTEIHKLPATFDAKVAGYPDHEMILNTACWLADLSNPLWHTMRNGELVAHFEFRDRITRHEGRYIPWGEPEDFYFSKVVQRLGLKALATRKVQLDHYGVCPYPNQGAWGEWKEDECTKPAWTGEVEKNSMWSDYINAVEQETEPDEEIPLAGISGGAGLRVCSDGTE